MGGYFLGGSVLHILDSNDRTINIVKRDKSHSNCVDDFNKVFIVSKQQSEGVSLQGTRDCKGLFIFPKKQPVDVIYAAHLYPTRGSLFNMPPEEWGKIKFPSSVGVILTGSSNYYDDNETNIGFRSFIDDLKTPFPNVSVIQDLILIDPFIEFCTIQADETGLHLFDYDRWVRESGEEVFIGVDTEPIPIKSKVDEIELKLHHLNYVLKEQIQ